jgi:surface polysaccharide O-acyltransferase-like enzyme
LFGDWYLHASYFALFVLGAALARAPAMWQRFAAQRWWALATAAAAWIVMATATAQPPLPAPWAWLYRSAFAAMQWSAIVAALGFASLHLDRDHAWRRYLTDAVFPVYILHQTLIVLFVMAFAAWSLQPWIEGPLLVVATFACSFAGYEIVRRIDWLRPWFGLVAAPVSSAARPIATVAA